MSINEQDIELFESYLSDLLTDEERASFEIRLTTDESFAYAFQLYKSSVKATKITAFMDDVKAVVEQKKSEGKNQSKNRIWLVVAASVSVIVMTYFIFFLPNYNKQLSFDELYKPYPNILQMRSDDTSKLNNALEYYSKGRYEEAFSKLSEISPKSDTVYFYMGLSTMSLQNFDEAIQDFSQININNSAFRNQLYWYQALIYLKKGDKEQVKNNLQRIDQKSRFYDQARQLIMQLSK